MEITIKSNYLNGVATFTDNICTEWISSDKVNDVRIGRFNPTGLTFKQFCKVLGNYIN